MEHLRQPRDSTKDKKISYTTGFNSANVSDDDENIKFDDLDSNQKEMIKKEFE